MSEGYQTLTEKEKQTLRLVVRGYDAKSLARRLGISVHTVNERLRHARRKMEVSSSREAARMLLDKESSSPDFLAYEQMGEAESALGVRHELAPDDGLKATNRFAWIIGGMLIMSLILATLALSSAMQVAEPTAGSTQVTAAATEASDAAVDVDIAQSARRWLTLVDEGRWEDSWNATGQAFRELNTSEKWASVSEEARPPLGAVLSRIASSQEFLPAPPYGYEMIKFRTSFANKPEATETVTLVREGSDWRVVGYWIS
jgi:DNA-binding CsgD family transcriptional regulator